MKVLPMPEPPAMRAERRAAIVYEIREAEGVAAFATDPSRAYALLDTLRAELAALDATEAPQTTKGATPTK